MTFQLLRLEPDSKALALWASRNGGLSPDGDHGYALHALFCIAFGNLAPKPFRYLGERQGLLAYSTAELEDLRLNASLAPPDVARALGLEKLDARAFPTVWKMGQRLGFEVRIRPVVRCKDGREQDAFLHAVGEAGCPEQASEQGTIARRQAVYSEWLTKQFGVDGAASLIEARMDSFSLTRVLRKGGMGENGRRKTSNTAGPDVVFKGQLEVGDPDAFQRLLARGVGRHRAFGFGMLLLRPAGSC